MPDEPTAGLEPWTVRARPALWLTAGFFALLAGVIAIAWTFYSIELPDPALSVRHPFPRPDLEIYLRHEHARLPNPPPPSAYGWTDRAHGRIHMPIERAMQVVASRGEQGWAPLQHGPVQ